MIVSKMVPDLKKMGLDNKDIEDFNRIIEKLKPRHGGSFAEMDEDDFIDIAVGPAQYPEEYLEQIAADMWRWKLFNS